MKPRSLRRLLVLQWTLFAAALLIGLAVVAALALFVLEDSFIDQRLLAGERALAQGHAPEPPLRLMRPQDFPVARREALSHLHAGALREFRLAPDRYVHLRALAPDAEGPRFLVLDAQDQLRVGPALRRSLPVLLGALGAVLALAAWLALRFVRRIDAAMQDLLRTLDRSADAAALRLAAASQPVAELQRFGNALADALDARLAALQRESETLRFLAHELRTPLQSARLALASLAPSDRQHAATKRLQRSLQRLERASAAVLWLGEATPAVDAVEVGPLLDALLEELAPLAAQRNQRFAPSVQGALHWQLPPAAVEAVLGNLLLNAIQHGAPGLIEIHLSRESLSIRNPAASDEDASGFGLGLVLSARLLGRIGWELHTEAGPGAFWLQVKPADQGLSSIPDAVAP